MISARYDYFMIQKASPSWILVGGSQHVPGLSTTQVQTLIDATIAALTADDIPDLPASKTHQGRSMLTVSGVLIKIGIV